MFVAAIAGDLLDAAVRLSSSVPGVGASGGISAVIVYYGLLFPHGRLRVFRFFRLIDMKVRAALLLWVLLQLIGALEQTGGETAVAYTAYLGGALIGLIFWALYGRGESRVLRVATAGRS